MAKYYAVIDTNVLVSALLKFQSVPRSILQLCVNGIIRPVYDDRMLFEYKEVLSRPKFDFEKEVIEQTLSLITGTGIKVDAENIDVQLPDPKDVVFYEVVMTERSKEDAYLVTGNIKHFPGERFIVTPREMLDIIIKDLT
jgi:putative PIN family toxin of toxin-antitoxin system